MGFHAFAGQARRLDDAALRPSETAAAGGGVASSGEVMDITDDDMGVNADDRVRIHNMALMTAAWLADVPRHKYTETLPPRRHRRVTTQVGLSGVGHGPWPGEASH